VTVPEQTQRKRAKTAVHFFRDNGSIIVRGTLDPQVALCLAMDEDEEPYVDDLMYKVARPRPGVGDPEPDAEHVQRFGDHLHELLRTARTGLYRMNVCRPGEEYAWWLMPVDARGHGVFEGVEFQC